MGRAHVTYLEQGWSRWIDKNHKKSQFLRRRHSWINSEKTNFSQDFSQKVEWIFSLQAFGICQNRAFDEIWKQMNITLSIFQNFQLIEKRIFGALKDPFYGIALECKGAIAQRMKCSEKMEKKRTKPPSLETTMRSLYQKNCHLKNFFM